VMCQVSPASSVGAVCSMPQYSSRNYFWGN